MTVYVPAAKADLAAFQQRKKFSDAQWWERGLAPSSKEISARPETEFNSGARQLSSVLDEADVSLAVEALLARALAGISRHEYDSEEAEFICDSFACLASIVGMEFGGHLNCWLYGEALGEERSYVAQQGCVDAWQCLVGISAVNRAASGISEGEVVEIDLKIDSAPRVVPEPPDLAKSLNSDAEARAAFDGLPFGLKRKQVAAIEGAKTPEVRQRRIAKLVMTMHSARD